MIESKPKKEQPTNVMSIVGRPCPRREPPPTDAELAEYRRMLPALRRMMAEWDTVKGPNGCPVLRMVLTGD